MLCGWGPCERPAPAAHRTRQYRYHLCTSLAPEDAARPPVRRESVCNGVPGTAVYTELLRAVY